MRLSILLTLLATAAFGQGFSYAPPDAITTTTGVTIATSQTVSGAKTFSATLITTHATKALTAPSGSKICLNGDTCTFYIQEFGSTVFIGGPLTTGVVNGTSFTAAATSGNSAFVAVDGARFCMNATCTHRLQGDGTASAIDTYFAGTLKIEVTATTTYLINDSLRLRAAISDDTASTPLTVNDTEGFKITSKTLPTCIAALEFTIQADVASGAATGKRSKMCLCTSNGSSVYAWQNMATATMGTTTTCGSE